MRLKNKLQNWVSAVRDTAAVMLLVVVLLVFAIGGTVLSWTYHSNGYENCRAHGSSVAWCVFTYKWQSFKALFS